MPNVKADAVPPRGPPGVRSAYARIYDRAPPGTPPRVPTIHGRCVRSMRIAGYFRNHSAGRTRSDPRDARRHAGRRRRSSARRDRCTDRRRSPSACHHRALARRVGIVDGHFERMQLDVAVGAVLGAQAAADAPVLDDDFERIARAGSSPPDNPPCTTDRGTGGRRSRPG